MRWAGTEQNSDGGKKSCPVLSRLWTKVHEIFGQCRRSFVISCTIARLRVSCFVQKIFTIVEVVGKPNKCSLQFSWPSFFPGWTTPTVPQQIVRAIYYPPFGKVWLSSVCWKTYLNMSTIVTSSIISKKLIFIINCNICYSYFIVAK